MFAGCIENKGTESIGSKLLDQMHTGGLAKFPNKSKAYWSGEFGDGCCATIIEQSIQEQECLAITVVNDVLVAGWLRLDNKEELFTELKLSKNSTDRELIIAAYGHWGEQVCEHLYGDFSFVIINLKQHSCLLCRDHMGVRPLYFYQDESLIFFSTSMIAFIAVDSLNIHFSEEYIARSCSSIASDWSLTVYEKIFKLPPAHIGKFSLTKSSINELYELLESSSSKVSLTSILIQQYFQFDASKQLILASEQDYIIRYREYLDEAVRCRVEDVEGVVASESSGGIDSSTVTAISAKYISKPKDNLHAYGFVTEVQEEECILRMSRFLGLKNTSLIKDNEQDLQLIQQAIDAYSDYSAAPITAQIATVHAPIYHRAKNDGSTVLLSGFGGDEFVTIYGATARVELFKNRQWNKWFNLFEGGFLAKRLKAMKWMLRFYINQNQFETASSLLAMAKQFLAHNVIKSDVFEQYNIKKIITRRNSYDAGCYSINEFSLKNRWSPDMVARLEECSLSAAAHGLEYRWPLLDVRLISFFLSVPSEYKLNNGIPRYLHRKAIQGLVPEHLIWKDKDMGGSIAPANNSYNSNEISELFDRGKVQFEQLHPRVQKVIDKSKWLAIIDELNLSAKRNDNSLRVVTLLHIMHPVLSLSEWLTRFKKD